LLPGAVARLSQVAANFGLEVRHPDAEVRRQRFGAGQNTGRNGNQDQRVLHQILTRLFLMELAHEHSERHAYSPSSDLKLHIPVPDTKTLILETKIR